MTREKSKQPEPKLVSPEATASDVLPVSSRKLHEEIMKAAETVMREEFETLRALAK